MRVNLGVHGRERTRQRTALLLREARRLIKNGHCEVLGPSKRREQPHVLCKLFFSTPDNDWFVAFHDEKAGKVITVWPLEYLKDYIPSARQKEVAKRRAEGKEDIPAKEVRTFRERFPGFSIPLPHQPISVGQVLRENLKRSRKSPE